MFYNFFAEYYKDTLSFANLFHYITFRSVIAMNTSFLFVLVFGQKFIEYVKKLQVSGQPIREYLENHQVKQGTPSMGGLIIIIACIFSSLIFADFFSPYIWLLYFVMLSFGTLGFIDDFLKIRYKNHHGVRPRYKFIIQTIISIIVCLCIQQLSPEDISSHLVFPLFKNMIINLSIFYYLFVIFILIGSSNAVNLTDGLDGLVTIPLVISLSCFAAISYFAGNKILADYLHINFIKGTGEICVLCGALIGACLGFLWFNAKPAQIFMGDTGSLALGGTLGTIAVITKHEILLGIIGGIFVIETMSVILQVYYFKRTGGKRIFLMSPLHHHFEKKGWSETQVVTRFWILSIFFAVFGMLILKAK